MYLSCFPGKLRTVSAAPKEQVSLPQVDFYSVYPPICFDNLTYNFNFQNDDPIWIHALK